MHHRDALIDRAAEAGGVRELFAAVSPRLRRLVPFDENLDDFGGKDACVRLWQLEYETEDVNPFTGLADAPLPAAGLRLRTDGGHESITTG